MSARVSAPSSHERRRVRPRSETMPMQGAAAGRERLACWLLPMLFTGLCAQQCQASEVPIMRVDMIGTPMATVPKSSRMITLSQPVEGPPPSVAISLLSSERSVPSFSWKTVAFFSLNSALFGPVVFLAQQPIKDVLGPFFSCSFNSLKLGLLYTVPMLVYLLPLHRLPGLQSLAEVTEASKTICLYAVGNKLVPLKATLAALVIALSASVFEELAFRGTMMALLHKVGLCCLPRRAATASALILQALAFGLLHSYTETKVYLVVATIAGLGFGTAFALTGNLFVPMVMHFVVDFVTFLVCHARVASMSQAQQYALVSKQSPIAILLRQAIGWTGPPPRAAANERRASATKSRNASNEQ